jgi:hypothetical protein
MRVDAPTYFHVPIVEGNHMTILTHNFSLPGRRLAAATIVLGMIGFLCGLLLALTVSAYSFYSCVQIL